MVKIIGQDYYNQKTKLFVWKGDYYNSNQKENEIDVVVLECFWQLVRECAPGVLEELKMYVLPIYDGLDIVDLNELNPLLVNWFLVEQSNSPTAISLRDSIISWAKNWKISQLTNVYNTALNTLYYWKKWPRSCGNNFVNVACFTIKPIRPYPNENLLPQREEWDPVNQSEEEYVQKVKNEMKIYLNKKKQSMVQVGYKLVPDKRNLEHFEWLVQYQVNDWSHDKIAKTYCKSRKTIGDGIRVASKMVNLPLRETGKPGRKKHR